MTSTFPSNAQAQDVFACDISKALAANVFESTLSKATGLRHCG